MPIIHVLWGIFIVVFLVALHEAAHGIVAWLFHFKIEYVAIGIPIEIRLPIPVFTDQIAPIYGIDSDGISVNGDRISEPVESYSTRITGITWKSWRFGGSLGKFMVGKLKCVLGILPFGGGVQINDDDFWEHPWWQRFLVALAGPVSNILIAYLILVVAFGFTQANSLIVEFIRATAEGIGLVAAGKVSAAEMGGPVQLVALTAQATSVDFKLGTVLMSVLISLGMAITNLIPLPALDGGQMLISVLSAFIGERIRKYAVLVMVICFYIILAATFLLFAKDIVGLFH